MCWWQGRLYVGTNRDFLCVERAAIRAAFPWLAVLPFVKYPPTDPDTDCAANPFDLLLQAEIWRWTPETDLWERVYQSPRQVPIPGRRGKYVAREIGFRDMASFVEPDGTEALYASGVSSQFVHRHVPAPPLLRSTDGLHFEPVPQEPGTCLGALEESTFRTMATHDGRFFVVGAGTVYGDGVLLEADNPALGNDHFRQVSPAGMRVFEMTSFHGYLYLGLRDTQSGYAVVKTEASGPPPYTFIPVVSRGAFLSPPSQSVISMHVFKDRLYVGTDGPAELIRVYPDDTWDLVIGTPRETPDGWKFPISGLDSGFHSWLNGHIWRLQSHEGRLYLGTMKMATHLRQIRGAEAVLKPNYGFDLFESLDGRQFVPITVNGFGDMFAFGVRCLASTPHGLFLGTANSWYGLQIWRGTPATSEPRSDATDKGPPGAARHASPKAHAQPGRVAVYHQAAYTAGLPRPAQLEVAYDDHKVVLSWTYPNTARRYRVWRADVADRRPEVESTPSTRRLLRLIRALRPLRPDVYMAPLPEKLWIPEAFVEVGATEHLYFVDDKIEVKKRFLYYVQAEDCAGRLSPPSNLVAAPRLGPAPTFDRVIQMLDSLADGGAVGATEQARTIRAAVRAAQAHAGAGEAARAEALLWEMVEQLASTECEAIRTSPSGDDLRPWLMTLARRVALSRAGVIPGVAL